MRGDAPRGDSTARRCPRGIEQRADAPRGDSTARRTARDAPHGDSTAHRCPRGSNSAPMPHVGIQLRAGAGAVGPPGCTTSAAPHRAPGESASTVFESSTERVGTSARCVACGRCPQSMLRCASSRVRAMPRCSGARRAGAAPLRRASCGRCPMQRRASCGRCPMQRRASSRVRAMPDVNAGRGEAGARRGRCWCEASPRRRAGP